MKTTILLDLSQTRVRLLDGDADPPTVLGEVALDDPDFEARIAALREAAGAGATGAIVLIPQSEILVFDLTPAGGGDAAEEAAIGRALEGRTPYALDDLAFDWRRRADGRIAVAAVARETLEEARAFAVAQGFAPARYGSLTAAPGFGARPDFGAPGAVASTPRPAMPAATDPATDAGPQAGEAPPPTRETPATERPPGPATVESPPGPAASRIVTVPKAPDRSRSPGPGPVRRPAPTGARRAIAAPAPADPASARRAQSGVPPRDQPPAAPMWSEGDGGASPHDPRLARAQRQLRQDSPEAGAKIDDAPRRPPPPRRGSGRAIVSVAAGLVAALALAGLIWSVFFLLGPGEPEIAVEPNEIAAIDETAPPPLPDPSDAIVAPTAPAAENPVRDRPEPPLDLPDVERDIANGPADAPASGIDAEGPTLPADTANPAPTPPDNIATLSDPPAPAGAAPQPSEMLPPPGEADGAPPRPAANEPVAPAPDAPERVQPTPEGAISASGVPVIAGPPPVTPPAAPGRPAPIADTAPETPETPASESARAVPVNEGEPTLRPASRPPGTEAPDTPEPDGAALPPAPDGTDGAALPRAPDGADDPALRMAGPDAPRPLPRPGVAEAPEAAALGDAARATIAALGPRPRPEDTAPDPTPPPSVVDSAAVAAAAARALAEPLPEPPQTIARSPSPATRPGDLARLDPPRPAPETAATPTRNRVASRATAPDEMQLSRVNLIGVYGAPDNRRALLRLPSGRFAKVKVGDRVDGGRVRAIGGADLSYVKGGRDITLQMPGG